MVDFPIEDVHVVEQLRDEDLNADIPMSSVPNGSELPFLAKKKCTCSNTDTIQRNSTPSTQHELDSEVGDSADIPDLIIDPIVDVTYGDSIKVGHLLTTTSPWCLIVTSEQPPPPAICSFECRLRLPNIHKVYFTRLCDQIACPTPLSVMMLVRRTKP
ncbi:hypothetical protein FRX31_012094 [Thalictrum thalictroides]|uniref:Uncharacterized protein n=1 Tax=Thalictrum thalictroides TaxID=46969 RepID=A0A7J6WLR9_THATH|nr:hypothetical protein FRX31_012094 [Thalictrum thalictroides]